LAGNMFGQLVERENVGKVVYKQNARPQAGDYGLFFSGAYAGGANDDGTKPAFPYMNNYTLVNFRYYSSSDFVWRAGLDLYKNKSTETYTNKTAQDPAVKEYFTKNSDYQYKLTGGFEKHFTPKNLLDVYVGLDGIIGYSDRIYVDNTDAQTGGQYTHLDQSGGAFMYGMSGFVGVQAFIADLPLSVGVEYGYLGKGYLFEKYHVVAESKIGTTTTTQDYYTSINNATPHDTYNARQFKLDRLVRITFCYYFKD
jgi:hypothetical protein